MAQWRRGHTAYFAQAIGIQEKVDLIIGDIAQSVFVNFLVQELAVFLGCERKLEAVIEARNVPGNNYWGYVSSLLQHVNYETVMMDTDYAEGCGATEIDQYEHGMSLAPYDLWRFASGQVALSRIECFPTRVVRSPLESAGAPAVS